MQFFGSVGCLETSRLHCVSLGSVLNFLSNFSIFSVFTPFLTPLFSLLHSLAICSWTVTSAWEETQVPCWLHIKRLFWVCLHYLHRQILVDEDRNVVLHMQRYHPIIKAIHRHFGWASSAKSAQLIRSFLLSSWVCCVCILYVCHYYLTGCSRTYYCFGCILPLQTCLKVLISAP